MKHKFVPLLLAAAAAFSLAAPASATTFTFTANLNGATESLATGSSALGLGVVTFDDVAKTVAVDELFFGLSGPATGGHIHCCTLPTAPIVLAFPTFPAAASGQFINTFTLSSAAFSSLLAGSFAGQAYLNIHTALNPSGEIRGFLVPTAVPEPATYALMFVGLAAVGAIARKRKPV